MEIIELKYTVVIEQKTYLMGSWQSGDDRRQNQ